MKHLKDLSKGLQNWVSDNNEKITKIDNVWDKYSYRIETEYAVSS